MWYCQSESCDEHDVGKEGYPPEVLRGLDVQCGTCGQPCRWEIETPEADDA
jgi:hypothetical protein